MTEPRPKYSRLPNWLLRAYALPGVVNVLSQIVRVPCSIAPLLPGSHWAVLYNDSAEWSLTDLENAFDRKRSRQRYNTRIWQASRDARRAHLSELWGFSDLTIPVVVGDEAQALICSGPFFRQPPDARALEAHWKDLSGRPARSLDPLFVTFVRLALRTPVLMPTELAAYRSLLEVLAEIVAGKGRPANQLARIERLRNRHFAKLPEAIANRVAIMIDPVKSAQWTADRLEYWDRDELGIRYLPNVALAVMRVDTALDATDTLTQMLALRDFQRRFVEFVRGFPDTLCTRLEDHGVFVLTRLSSDLKLVQARGRLRKLGEALAEFARKELKVQISIGVGSLGRTSKALPEYARQAIVAMQLARHDEVPLLFYDDRPRALEPGERSIDLERRLISTLIEAPDELPATRTEYVRRVLEESTGSSGVVRVRFEHCLRGALERVHTHHPLDGKTHRALIERLSEELDHARTTANLVHGFRHWLDTLGELTKRPGPVSVELRLERAAAYVRQRAGDDLRLARVSREAGLSPAYFSHLFKARLGVGYSQFLRERRIERASELLAKSSLSVAQVAAECGFGSLAHFHAVFKRATTQTPADYRAAARGDRRASTSTR